MILCVCQWSGSGGRISTHFEDGACRLAIKIAHFAAMRAAYSKLLNVPSDRCPLHIIIVRGSPDTSNDALCLVRASMTALMSGLQKSLPAHGSQSGRSYRAAAKGRNGRRNHSQRSMNSSVSQPALHATSATFTGSTCRGENRAEDIPPAVSVTMLPAGISCHLVSVSVNGSETRQWPWLPQVGAE